MGSLVLTDVQQVTLNVSPVSARGNPALLDGTPVWTTSDDLLVSVMPSGDGLSALVVATGKVGSCQVSVTADADLGEGVKQLTGVIDIVVQPSMAVSLGINSTKPVDAEPITPPATDVPAPVVTPPVVDVPVVDVPAPVADVPAPVADVPTTDVPAPVADIPTTDTPAE